MPIRRSERDRYPSNWKAISYAAIQAAGWRCQACGAHNGAWGYRDRHGAFRAVRPRPLLDAGYGQPPFWMTVDGRRVRVTVISLATAHRDHQPENIEPDNLVVLCQAHHLAHDAEHHRRVRATNAREAMATPDLFL